MSSRHLSELCGLGPKSANMLASIDVNDIDVFRSRDPVLLYQQLLIHYPALSINMLYAMVGAQQDIHWQQVAREQRKYLLMRLDDLNIAPP